MNVESVVCINRFVANIINTESTFCSICNVKIMLISRSDRTLKENCTFQGWSAGILRKIIARLRGTCSTRWQCTARERCTRENRSSRYRDQRPTRLVPFSIAVLIFDNFHHFPAFSSLLLLILVEAVSGIYVVQSNSEKISQQWVMGSSDEYSHD